MSLPITQRANGRWEEIFRANAPELAVAMDNAAGHRLKHSVCPVHGTSSGDEDAFRLFPEWRERGNGICNTCGAFSNGVDMLKWVLGEDFKSVASRIEAIIGKDADWKPGQKDLQAEANLLRLKRIQGDAKRAGVLVAPYLASRGLRVATGLFEGRMAYWDEEKKVGEFAVMLAKFVSPSGKPVTWHVTYLDGDRKAAVKCPRKIMPSVDAEDGGAVRLMPAGEVLGIAEGIETALAASSLHGGIPVWAALNAENLAKFKPPPEVKHLMIFGDNDASCTGQAVAYTLARRLYKRIPLREVHIPPMLGMDWADVLKEKIELGEYKP